MSNSVSRWIPGLKLYDDEATQKLWDYFSDRLVALARRKLGNAPKRMADEEDIVLQLLPRRVFRKACQSGLARRVVVGTFGNYETKDR